MLGFLQKPQQQAENFPYRSGPRYYLKMNGQARGPYAIDELRRVPGFTLQSPLCLTPNGEWKPAFTLLDLKAYLTQPTKSNDWDQAAARAEKERIRQIKKTKWLFRKQKIARFFRRLVYWTLGLSFMIVVGYAASAGQIQPTLWKEHLTVLAHQKIQWSIHRLQNLDNRYFLPKAASAKLTVIPPSRPAAKASSYPSSALQSAVHPAVTKPRDVVAKRKQLVRNRSHVHHS